MKKKLDKGLGTKIIIAVVISAIFTFGLFGAVYFMQQEFGTEQATFYTTYKVENGNLILENVYVEDLRNAFLDHHTLTSEKGALFNQNTLANLNSSGWNCYVEGSTTCIGSDLVYVNSDRCSSYTKTYKIYGTFSIDAVNGYVCNVNKQELFNTLPTTFVRADGVTRNVQGAGISGKVVFGKFNSPVINNTPVQNTTNNTQTTTTTTTTTNTTQTTANQITCWQVRGFVQEVFTGEDSPCYSKSIIGTACPTGYFSSESLCINSIDKDDKDDKDVELVGLEKFWNDYGTWIILVSVILSIISSLVIVVKYLYKK